MLSKLAKSKIQLLESLLSNLKIQDDLLSQNDPDTAVEWEIENEKILHKLIQVDKKMEYEEESLPFSETEIQSSSLIFELLEQAREVQIRVQAKLQKYRDQAKSELNQMEIKRQLRSHLTLQEGLHWKKRIC
ncbi:MAG: flagellar protein FlgN [Leptospiraceae bacterium]|nr:flagellar protein FlgN [Leptospiraceae bacterium]